MRRLAGALARVLPTGHALPHGSWVRRHNGIVVLLWLHVLVVPVYGTLGGAPLGHALLQGGVLGTFATLAALRRLRTGLRETTATLGLVSASAMLVQLSGGLVEMTFHFFVMVVVVSLYQSWLPFLLAIGFVVGHHGLVGTLDPEAVFNHPAALASPWRWSLVHGFFLLGQSAACLVAWRLNEDALERERAARGALEKANVDLAEAQAMANMGSWDWDLHTGAVTWSAELYSLTGRDPETFTPTLESFLEVVHPDDRYLVAAMVEGVHVRQPTLDYECRIVRPDGAVRVVSARGQCVTCEDGRPVKVVGAWQDITERKALEQEIEHRALHDPLTGLGNRTLFLDRVDHALTIAQRSGAPLTVLYLDLDDFKGVNDSLGHATGDDLLVEIARRLTQAVRASDTVARLGGDEFAVLLENTGLAGAREITDRVGHVLQAPVLLQGKQHIIRSSIGIALASPGARPEDIVRDADIAMYTAKREGKGNSRVFTPDMRSSVITRMELKAELTEALEHGQFVVHYQPMIALDTGELQGLEALVRWEHPVRGLLPPAEFIPLAEETGQIVRLGAWVTMTAAYQAKALQEELDARFSMSVNLSSEQLSSDVVSMVREVLVASRLDPSDLVLEVTETSLIRQDDANVDKLEALRALGVRIALDDFGTGYSSLGYLQRLPIDILKIDRSFVQCTTDGVEESALAHAIVKLGETLQLGTVGEGIETADQAQALRRFGCHSGQGFFFSKPLTADQLLDHVRDLTSTAKQAVTR